MRKQRKHDAPPQKIEKIWLFSNKLKCSISEKKIEFFQLIFDFRIEQL